MGNETWKLVDRPSNKKTVTSKWITNELQITADCTRARGRYEDNTTISISAICKGLD
jgi:hypothetical protein